MLVLLKVVENLSKLKIRIWGFIEACLKRKLIFQAIDLFVLFTFIPPLLFL